MGNATFEFKVSGQLDEEDRRVFRQAIREENEWRASQSLAPLPTANADLKSGYETVQLRIHANEYKACAHRSTNLAIAQLQDLILKATDAQRAKAILDLTE